MRITSEDLEEGEVICNKCEGGGSWPGKFLELEQATWSICPKCQGVGKLDWVERVTGKPRNPYLFTLPITRKIYPKLIASELVSVQPMDKLMEVNIWQKADTSWLGLKLWRRLLTIFSKGKEGDGTKTSQENTSPLF